jgi:hypothetical protein
MNHRIIGIGAFAAAILASAPVFNADDMQISIDGFRSKSTTPASPFGEAGAFL